MEYTVKKFARLTGISVRTLHYYDEIGLLHPASVSKSGYRQYGENELARLQHILFFRELEFSLQDIQKMMNAPHFDSHQALLDHKELLTRKKLRLDHLIEALDQALNTKEGAMSVPNIPQAFSTENVDQYKEEVQQRWGDTQAYKQSQERVKQMTKDDWSHLGNEMDRIMKSVLSHMHLGVSSAEVQADMKEYHAYIQNFYDCTPQFMANLGEMYVADERFTASYDKYDPKLATFLRDALAVYGKK